jgi:hypothetical protein
MASVFVRSHIADFGKWKPIFEEHEATRKKFGFTGHSLHRDADDPNVIVIAFRVSDIGKAKEFAASDDLRETMARAGVQGPPEMWFCEDIEG